MDKDSGMASLHELLAWGIQNSDPDALRRAAEAAKAAQPSSEQEQAPLLLGPASSSQPSSSSHSELRPLEGASSATAYAVSREGVQKENERISAASSSSSSSPLPPAPEKKWMDLVLPDDVKRMKQLLEDISDKAASEDAISFALEELEYLVEGIDNACDLEKVGGLQQIIDLLKHELTQVRVGSASVLATASQNNPAVQKIVIQRGGLKVLIEMLRNESESVEVKRKVLYAISSIVRSNSASLSAFSSSKGFDSLASVMKSPLAGSGSAAAEDTANLKSKAVFLLFAIASDVPQIRAVLSRIPGLLESLCIVLEQAMSLEPKGGDLAERTLQCIGQLVKDCPMNYKYMSENCQLESRLAAAEQRLPCAPANQADDEHLDSRQFLTVLRASAPKS